VFTCVCVHVCMYARVCTCVHVCTCVRVHVCVFVVCACACVSVCVYCCYLAHNTTHTPLSHTPLTPLPHTLHTTHTSHTPRTHTPHTCTHTPHTTPHMHHHAVLAKSPNVDYVIIHHRREHCSVLDSFFPPLLSAQVSSSYPPSHPLISTTLQTVHFSICWGRWVCVC
jgi:hypothetical protein